MPAREITLERGAGLPDQSSSGHWHAYCGELCFALIDLSRLVRAYGATGPVTEIRPGWRISTQSAEADNRATCIASKHQLSLMVFDTRRQALALLSAVLAEEGLLA